MSSEKAPAAITPETKAMNIDEEKNLHSPDARKKASKEVDKARRGFARREGEEGWEKKKAIFGGKAPRDYLRNHSGEKKHDIPVAK